MPLYPEYGGGGLDCAGPVPQLSDPEKKISGIIGNSRQRNPFVDIIRFRRMFAGIGSALFIFGLFIPTVRYISPKTPVSIFSINPFFSIVYLVFAVIALILILLHYSMVPQFIGIILGIYLIIIAIPAILNGTLDASFGVLVTGDVLLMTGI